MYTWTGTKRVVISLLLSWVEYDNNTFKYLEYEYFVKDDTDVDRDR